MVLIYTKITGKYSFQSSIGFKRVTVSKFKFTFKDVTFLLCKISYLSILPRPTYD